MNGHHSSKRMVYTASIVVEEGKDGFWWLRGQHLKEFRRLTGFRSEGEAAGMDLGLLYTYAHQLAGIGVEVILQRASGLTAFSSIEVIKPKHMPSSSIYLAVELLTDSAERERLCKSVHLGEAQLRQLRNNLGKLYVYPVSDAYEIDWELTRLPRASVEALLVGACKLHWKIPCRLVLPKAQRARRHVEKASNEEVKVTQPRLV